MALTASLAPEPDATSRPHSDSAGLRHGPRAMSAGMTDSFPAPSGAGGTQGTARITAATNMAEFSDVLLVRAPIGSVRLVTKAVL